MDDGTLTLAQHYLDIDQPSRALTTLESGRPDVSDAAFWRLRAAALYELDRYAEALDAAASGLAIDADDIGLLVLHGLANSHLGHIAAAERSLLAALRLDPESVWLLAEYALLVARAGQFEKARKLIDEAARIHPLSDHVATARDVLAYLEGDDARAAAHAEELLAADPEARSAHLLRGVALSQQGRSRAARPHFETVARYDPGDEDVVDMARHSRYATHPLLLPLAPIARWGQGRVWLAGVALIGLARATGSDAVMLAVGGTWLLYVVYTWVVPPLVRGWLERRRI
jgi:tetratricopeptide (TPR) repeat protein